jgi:hydrogenase maturation protease
MMDCANRARTLILGLGNPVLGDDGAGWHVADLVRTQAQALDVGWRRDVEFDSVSVGGLSLMERVLGYDRVILIDAMQTGLETAGQVRVWRLDELPNPGAGHSSSAHDATLMTALEFARATGAEIPARIEVVGIEAVKVVEFSDALTEAVSSAVPQAARTVWDLLEEEEA